MHSRIRMAIKWRPGVAYLFVVANCLPLGACGPSSHGLTSLASHGFVQQDAPIKASSTLIIEAPRERVWRILVDVARWPRWEPDISHVSGAHALATGTAFAWQTGGATIHSRVALFSPPNMVAWTGRAATARAIHVFVLTSLGPNRTQIESRESMSGFLITWFYGSAALQKSEDSQLRYLANAVQAGEG